MSPQLVESKKKPDVEPPTCPVCGYIFKKPCVRCPNCGAETGYIDCT